MRFVGGAGQALGEWTQRTAMGIKLGKVANITNAPIVQNSGGVLPLVVMVLNVLNARKYLFELQAVARPDEQRVHDTASSVLYAGAALTAVIDNQIRKSFRLDAFALGKTAVPYMTAFGALIGVLSAGAAVKELQSLEAQLESSSSVDPWLQMRRNVAGGLAASYGLQALAGFYWTARVLLGLSTVGAAIVGYSLWVAPVLIAVAGLGVLYFITWLFQQTPLQRFLDDCCWSKNKARNLEPIVIEAQRDELERLIGILHTPRVSFSSSNHVISSPRSPRSIEAVSVIDALTIDLPGADPNYMNLELAMIGYAVDQEQLDGQAAGVLPKTQKPPREWIDLVPTWLAKSKCKWTPAEEGQGLRLSGSFTGSRNLSNPTEVNLRIRFRTPFMALLGETVFVGGKSGMTFALSNKNGVLSIRNEAPEGPGYKTNYVLARDTECSGYLQPGVKI
ncbi:hypothetical protein DCO48_08400 [Pseudomonas sp. SDI]|nr:hypothetical protein DCO48_08400 [Pseudomonas sp. SDI]